MTNLLTNSVNLVPWWLRDRIRRIPLIAGLQRSFFNFFLAGKEFDYEISAGPAKGLMFPIKLPDDKLIWTGTWEKEIAEVIAENVQKRTVSYDIGSHRGFMAGIMALAGASQVYCFEPNPENIEHLSMLRKLNPDLNLKVLDYAVSDKDGMAEFSIMPESSMGKLSESSFQSGVDNEGKIQVKVKALDNLIENGEIEMPGFVKIDVEGAEYSVLQGARKLIEKCWPTFVIELHSFNLANDCKKFLDDYGYSSRIIQNGIDLQQEQTFSVCHLLATKPE
jgi:FkbM family methyltransferase